MTDIDKYKLYVNIVMDKAVGCYAYGNMFCWL